MTERHEDERLARWIGAVRAEADPVLWTRVRARVAAGDELQQLPAWLAWLLRPSALGTAVAAVTLVCGAGLVTIRSGATAAAESSATSLTEALLDEVTESAADAPVTPPDASPGDTGATG